MTVEFVVKATGGSGSRTFVNSESSFRDEKNFTVVLERQAPQKLAAKLGADDLKVFLKDKKVRVTGKVEMFQGKAQIKVDDAEQVQIVP